ncbi:hypothetical protein ACWCP6_05280 [Streptomyces sp. NPDC002004]
MEQRIGQNLTPPVTAAATDPAYIPGLMAPRGAAPADAAPERKEEDETAEHGPEAGVDADMDADADADADGDGDVERDVEDASGVGDDGSDSSADGISGSADTGSDTADTGADTAVGTSDAAGPKAVTGPVFDVSDRRGSITLDSTGVRFTLDDQEAEWTWDEIAAVEYATARFGRRLTVTVHTPNKRWYPAEVEAPARARLKEWAAQLDEVLDAHFEDEDKGANTDAGKAEVEAGSNA